MSSATVANHLVFGVYRLGFEIWVLGFRVWGLEFRFEGLEFRVWGLGVGVSRFEIQAELALRVYFRV